MTTTVEAIIYVAIIFGTVALFIATMYLGARIGIWMSKNKTLRTIRDYMTPLLMLVTLAVFAILLFADDNGITPEGDACLMLITMWVEMFLVVMHVNAEDLRGLGKRKWKV